MIGWLKQLLGASPRSLQQDPRWIALHASDYACSCCGLVIDGIFDIGMDHPDQWPHGTRRDSGHSVLQIGDDFLSSDLCAIGDDRFVRGVLNIPIQGSDKCFAFGVWCSLKPENFEDYAENGDTLTDMGATGYFGWLCNALPYYNTVDPLPTDVVFQDNMQRPKIEIHDIEHPLRDAQENGISFDTLLDIYEAAGTPIRAHLPTRRP